MLFSMPLTQELLTYMYFLCPRVLFFFGDFFWDKHEFSEYLERVEKCKNDINERLCPLLLIS